MYNLWHLEALINLIRWLYFTTDVHLRTLLCKFYPMVFLIGSYVM